jgi:hypothetical protein
VAGCPNTPPLVPCVLGVVCQNNNVADDVLCPFRTNQRADITGYRSLREAWVGTDIIIIIIIAIVVPMTTP